jgi:uncharacterized protein YndB with AHSA1/START domain
MEFPKRQSNDLIEGHELIIRRHFNGSAERVYKVWTTPELLERWWGPTGFTVPFCKIDLRVGGEYHYCMRSPQGVDYWSKGTFLEIFPGRKIVATDSFSDANGSILSPVSVGLPGSWPSTLIMTVVFTVKDRGTQLTLIHKGLPLQMVESCRAGWTESLEKLERVL